MVPGIREPFEIGPYRTGPIAGWVMIGVVLFMFGPGVLYSLIFGAPVSALFVGAFVAVWCTMVLRFVNVRVRVDEAGLRVRNMRGTRQIPWYEVQGFHCNSTRRNAQTIDVWLMNDEALTLDATRRPGSARRELDEYLAALESWLPPR